MPTIHFTVRTLNAIKPRPGATSTEYWDASRPGFGLRVNAAGRRVWVVRYRVRGTRALDRATLGTYESMTLADARILAAGYLDAAQRGINLKIQRADEQVELERKKAEKSKTFGWLVSKYLADPQVQKNRSYNRVKRILEKEVLEFRNRPGMGWKDRHLGAITKSDVRELLEKILERTQVQNGKRRSGKGIMANRVFSIIRRVFNYGLEKDIITTSPCAGLKRPLKNEISRDHVLSMDQLRTLWKVLDAEAAHDKRYPNPRKETTLLHKKALIAIFKLMVLTAQRGAEVRSMAWADLDLQSNIWTIPGEKTKNKKAHTVPLSTQTLELVREMEPNRAMSLWVFPSQFDPAQHIEHFQKAIQRFRTSADVPYVGHDLRRTAASQMAAIGVPPHVIKHILNHSDGKDITEVYNRYAYEAEKREALQIWGDHLIRVVNKKGEVKVVPITRSKSRKTKAEAAANV